MPVRRILRRESTIHDDVDHPLLRPLTNPRIERVLLHVLQNPGSTAAEIRESLGMTQCGVDDAIGILRIAGLLESLPNKKRYLVHFFNASVSSEMICPINYMRVRPNLWSRWKQANASLENQSDGQALRSGSGCGSLATEPA